MTATNAPKDMGEVLRQMAERIQRLESQIVHGYDTGWIAPTLLNGWVNYGSIWETAAYRKKNGIVYIRGLIRNGTATSGTDLFILPAGFRPGMNSHVIVPSNGLLGIVNIMTTGEVDFNTGTNAWMSLSNISFPSDN